MLKFQDAITSHRAQIADAMWETSVTLRFGRTPTSLIPFVRFSNPTHIFCGDNLSICHLPEKVKQCASFWLRAPEQLLQCDIR